MSFDPSKVERYTTKLLLPIYAYSKTRWDKMIAAVADMLDDIVGTLKDEIQDARGGFSTLLSRFQSVDSEMDSMDIRVSGFEELVTSGQTFKGPYDISGGTFPGSPVQGDYWVISVSGVVGAKKIYVGNRILYTNLQWVVIGDPLHNENLPTIRPSLLLDFANSKVLDPRITHTRASAARYYDDHTVAKAEENLLTYSQDFSNAAWTKAGFSLFTTTTAPDGSGTATEATLEGGVFSAVYRSPTGDSDNSTVSIYAKAGTKTVIQLACNIANWGADKRANFNLADGTLGSVDGDMNASIFDVGGGWYRCVASPLGAGTQIIWCVVDSETSVLAAPATAGTISIWGAQLEHRSSVTAYTPTTTQPITNYIPVLLTAAANECRFHHDPVTRESLGIYVEGAATNLLTYSEDFANAAWSKLRCSVDSNQLISPDGLLTMDKLVPDSGEINAAVYQSGGIFELGNNVANVNLATGEIHLIVGFTSSEVSAEDAGNGVWRIKCNKSGYVGSVYAKLGEWGFAGVQLYTEGGEGRLYVYARQASDGSGVGDGFSGIYIWGAQLETGSVATSYIKTEASTVTRAADVATMTGTNFSQWYNQEEGTVVVEGVIYRYSPSTGNNYPGFIRAAGNYAVVGLYSYCRLLGQILTSGANPGPDAGFSQTFRTAYTFRAQSEWGVSQNGSVPATASISFNPSNAIEFVIAGASFGGYTYNSTVKSIAYYPKRVSNDELQALTA